MKYNKIINFMLKCARIKCKIFCKLLIFRKFYLNTFLCRLMRGITQQLEIPCICIQNIYTEYL